MGRTTRDRRRLFLEGLPPVLGLLERACWKSFAPARHYPALVAEVAAETASRSAPYDSLVVVVDGGSIAEFVPIKHALRARALGWRKVLGARDQAEPLLRLADAVAGFVRDKLEGDKVAVAAWPALEGLLTEL